MHRVCDVNRNDGDNDGKTGRNYEDGKAGGYSKIKIGKCPCFEYRRDISV